VTAGAQPFPSAGVPTVSARPRVEYLLFGAPIVALAVIALLPGLLAPSLDAAVFSLIGDRVSVGQLPYVQLFDHKPPGMYFLIAGGQLLSGTLGAWKVSWVLSVASVALTGTLVADTLRALGWRRLAWATGAICVAELASFPLALGGGLGETVAVFPAVAALRWMIIGQWRHRTWLVVGMLAAAAAAISLQAAPVVLALMAAAIARASRVRTSWLVPVVWIAAGSALVWSTLLIGLGSMGATGAALQALVGYNRVYAGLAALDSPVVGEAIHAFLILSPLAVLAAAGLRTSFARPSQFVLACAALTWIVASIALIWLQGRLELHYTTLIVPPLALLAPAGLAQLQIRGTFRGLARSAVIAAFLVAAFGVSTLLSAAETTMAMQARSAQAARSGAVASWIDRHASASTKIFVWGNVPELYLDSDRSAASPYVYLLPLTTPGFTSQRLIGEVLADWEASPPGIIVDAGSAEPGTAGLPPLLIQRPTLRLDGRNADLLNPLRDFVRQRYRLATTIEGWPRYILDSPIS
jgi:hypothetical protein